MGLVFLKQIGNGMVWSVIALYGQELGAGPTLIGLLVSCYGGARLMANLPSGLASERFGRRRLMQIGCVLLTLASFGIVLTHSIEAFFVGILLLGMASASFMTAALAAVADLATSEVETAPKPRGRKAAAPASTPEPVAVSAEPTAASKRAAATKPTAATKRAAATKPTAAIKAAAPAKQRASKAAAPAKPAAPTKTPASKAPAPARTAAPNTAAVTASLWKRDRALLDTVRTHQIEGPECPRPGLRSC
jgi:hypothetical protein